MKTSAIDLISSDGRTILWQMDESHIDIKTQLNENAISITTKPDYGDMAEEDLVFLPNVELFVVDYVSDNIFYADQSQILGFAYTYTGEEPLTLMISLNDVSGERFALAEDQYYYVTQDGTDYVYVSQEEQIVLYPNSSGTISFLVKDMKNRDAKEGDYYGVTFSIYASTKEEEALTISKMNLEVQEFDETLDDDISYTSKIAGSQTAVIPQVGEYEYEYFIDKECVLGATNLPEGAYISKEGKLCVTDEAMSGVTILTTKVGEQTLAKIVSIKPEENSDFVRPETLKPYEYTFSNLQKANGVNILRGVGLLVLLVVLIMFAVNTAYVNIKQKKKEEEEN